MSDSFFMYPQHQKSISTIYAPTTFQIQIEDVSAFGVGAGAGRPHSQAFSISVDQLSSNDLLVIFILLLLFL